jgi:hypothetical protein
MMAKVNGNMPTTLSRKEPMSDPYSSFFSPDYATAKERFLALAANQKATTWQIPLSAKGPQDSALSIDIALLGSPNAKRVVLHCSGLHGIEGFAGSAIQLALLSDTLHIPADCAVVFVHALNPYGMAWLRRVNENNVDLNRNFLGAEETYTGAPDHYIALNHLLNPESPPQFDFFLLRTIGKILKSGFNALKQAIVGGQYDYPKGLFYGGKHLEEGPQLYTQWLREHLSQAEQLVAVDIHTGLGKQGHDTLLVEGGPDSDLYTRMEAIFGDHVAPWDPETSVAYAIRGGHGAGVAQTLPEAQVQFVTQEFGTLAPLKVLHALREENRLHHWEEKIAENEPNAHPCKQQLLRAFRPDSAPWRRAVVDRGSVLMAQASHLAFDPKAGQD